MRYKTIRLDQGEISRLLGNTLTEEMIDFCIDNIEDLVDENKAIVLGAKKHIEIISNIPF